MLRLCAVWWCGVVQVVGLLMSQKTVNKIWEKALWDEEAEEWHLPRIRNRASGGTGRNAAVKLPGIAAPSPSGEQTTD